MDLTLYAQYYRCKTADRQREIDECLRRNLNHPGIRKLVLFKESDAPPLPEATVELEVVESDERITYAEWFRWVQRQGSGIGLLLNADIYLDEGLEHLTATFDSAEAFLALTRYNPGHAGFHLNDYPHWTQDVWGVRADADLPESLLYASSGRLYGGMSLMHGAHLERHQSAGGCAGPCLAVPEQAAAEGLECRIQAHEGQPAQFGLGREESVECVAMCYRVADGMEAMHKGYRQRFKALSGEQLGQIVQQVASRFEGMALAHSNGWSIAASSSSGSGTSRAQGLPPLATTMVSPAWAASQVSPHPDQAGGHR